MTRAPSNELRDEYSFDYLQAKKNRFAGELPPGGRIVYLDPQVAVAFPDSESVNKALRAILTSPPLNAPPRENTAG